MGILFSNYAFAELESQLPYNSNTFTLSNSAAYRLFPENPSISTTDYQYLLLTDGTNFEVIKVVRKSQGVFVIERGQEDRYGNPGPAVNSVGGARTWPAGTRILSNVSAGVLKYIINTATESVVDAETAAAAAETSRANAATIQATIEDYLADIIGQSGSASSDAASAAASEAAAEASKISAEASAVSASGFRDQAEDFRDAAYTHYNNTVTKAAEAANSALSASQSLANIQDNVTTILASEANVASIAGEVSSYVAEIVEAYNNIVPPPAGSSATVVISDSAPATPSQGELWWHSTHSKLLVFYNDGVGAGQWVDASIPGPPGTTLHANLSDNTSGDWHTQYTKTDGSRIVTGVQQFNLGIKPFQNNISSTTTLTRGVQNLTYYEEGSWTPAITYTTTTPTYTYTFRSATYTRIGNICKIFITISVSTVTGTPSGVLLIGPLPYPCSSVNRAQAINIVDAGINRNQYYADLAAMIVTDYTSLNGITNTPLYVSPYYIQLFLRYSGSGQDMPYINFNTTNVGAISDSSFSIVISGEYPCA